MVKNHTELVTDYQRKPISGFKIVWSSSLIVLFLVLLAGCAYAAGPYAYITNSGSDSVSVIDLSSNTVVDSVSVGGEPYGVAVTPDGTKVYVTNYVDDTVSVIDTSSDTVISTITVGWSPEGIAVTPDGTKVYVANHASQNVSVIDTSSNTVIASVHVGTNPLGVAVTPDGTNVYVTNNNYYGTIFCYQYGR